MEDCALFHFGHPTLMRHMYEEEGAGGGIAAGTHQALGRTDVWNWARKLC
ncbi:hypothetical protein [uncultured Acetatifactor sp.]|nr:hypothetical protein [uncultured Acetatifactor sp.]